MFRDSNVLVTGGNITYVTGDAAQKQVNAPQLLYNYAVASAVHNSGEVSDQPKCHPGTRVAILDHLMAWAAMLTYEYPVIWLHGPAGAGKSAILRTIAQMLFDKGHLLGSFFFFRSATGRNTSERFIVTLAWQLALSVPATRPHIEQAIETNPLIFSLSLWDQARTLIISPILAVFYDPSFHATQLPRVIIVDGLDECHDPNKQCGILQILSRIIKTLPIPLAVLVASRPEHHIRAAFDLGDLNRSSSRLSLDNSYKPDEDIETYLVAKFDAIRTNHPLKSYLPTSSPWPSQTAINQLVAKASGQFIYASTVDKFVSSTRHHPAKRLNIILGLLNAGNLKPFEQLDILYSTIFEIIDQEDLPDVLRALGVLLVPFNRLEGLLTPKFLERLLELETGEIRRLFLDLESLLDIRDDDENVRFFHASLSDYLFDRSRSAKFWIDSGNIYADVAQQCVRHLSRSPKWRKLRRFFLENIELFVSKATPTPGLHKAIKECDLEQIVNYDEYHIKKGVDIPPVLLLLIRDSEFSDAKNLYRVQLEAYARIIKPMLQMYFEDVDLKHCLIAATVTTVQRIEGDLILSPSYLPTYMFPLLETNTTTEWRCGFRLVKMSGLTSDYPVLQCALKQVIKDILDDPQGQYFIDGNQYADTALFMMKSMINHACQPRPNKPQTLDKRHLSNIYECVLSKSCIRRDLLEFIKENSQLLMSSLIFSPIRDAITIYVSRSETEVEIPRESLHLGHSEISQSVQVVPHQAFDSELLSLETRISSITGVQSPRNNKNATEPAAGREERDRRSPNYGISKSSTPFRGSNPSIQRPEVKAVNHRMEGEASGDFKESDEPIPTHEGTAPTASTIAQEKDDPSLGSSGTLLQGRPHKAAQGARSVHKPKESRIRKFRQFFNTVVRQTSQGSGRGE